MTEPLTPLNFLTAINIPAASDIRLLDGAVVLTTPAEVVFAEAIHRERPPLAYAADQISVKI